MKRYNAPFGRCHELKHEHPERTAQKSGPGVFSDVYFQVWPNRESMARAIRMQERGVPRPDHWKPLVPLSPGEGR